MSIKVSIIIPCFNEERHIKSCLESVRNQEFPSDRFEVIVVDNESTDNSPRISEKLSDKVIFAPHINVGAVRNIGATIAKGELLAFIDADCLIDEHWIARASDLLEKDKTSIFGGGCLLPIDANWLERNWLLEGSEGNTLPKELIGCSIALSINTFKQLQGFDEHLKSGEDTDLSNRARDLGIPVVICRDLNVVHLGNAKTIISFIKRQLWHSKSYEDLGRKVLKDPVFIITTIFTLSIISSTIKPFPFFIMAMACPAALSMKRALRARPIHVFKRLPIIYLVDFIYISSRATGLSLSLAKITKNKIFKNFIH